MSDERCEMTDLLVRECAHCKPADTAVWSAQYETICRHPSCLQVIEKGERVKWAPDGAATIHARHR